MRKEDKGGGMMERLTREATFEEEYIILQKEVKELFDKEDRESEPPEIHCVVRRALRCIKKLVAEVASYKAYKDLEEQGLLLRLPCKIGDTIYEVSYENREFVIKEHIVKEFIYRAYRFPRIEIYCENENGFLACNNIGKLDECLFLTQAEAEQQLKEMDGD